ncbi:MAG: hypothetical protein VYA08_04090 [Pseudomonadota bacterium]|nr:hypothetical protein [Pseudomonadota bacterium]
MNPCEVRKNPFGTHVLIWSRGGRFQADDSRKIELFGYATQQRSAQILSMANVISRLLTVTHLSPWL